MGLISVGEAEMSGQTVEAVQEEEEVKDRRKKMQTRQMRGHGGRIKHL